MFGFPWSEFALLCGAALLGIVCIMPYTLELSRDALKGRGADTPAPVGARTASRCAELRPDSSGDRPGVAHRASSRPGRAVA